MKSNRLLTVCALAAALFGAGELWAQDANANDAPPATPPANKQNDDQNGGDNGRRRNFDPAQMQQRLMENVRTQLNFTNDTEWAAVQPLVQKVFDTRRDVGFGGMGRLFGRNRGGGGNRGGGMFGQQSPEGEALQKAIDDNAPAGQIKDLLAKYKAVQKDKQAKLDAAQADLKNVLSVRQEAEATLLGLVN